MEDIIGKFAAQLAATAGMAAVVGIPQSSSTNVAAGGIGSIISHRHGGEVIANCSIIANGGEGGGGGGGGSASSSEQTTSGRKGGSSPRGTSGRNLMDILEVARERWLKPAELESLLLLQTSPPLPVSPAKPPSPPPSGTLLLYDRSSTSDYKDDGRIYVRKRNNWRKVREDHVKLRIGGRRRVAGCYVHDADCATFKRRAYHLLDYDTGKTAVRPRMAGVKKIDSGGEEDEGDQDDEKNGDDDDYEGGSKRGGGGGVNVSSSSASSRPRPQSLILVHYLDTRDASKRVASKGGAKAASRSGSRLSSSLISSLLGDQQGSSASAVARGRRSSETTSEQDDVQDDDEHESNTRGRRNVVEDRQYHRGHDVAGHSISPEGSSSPASSGGEERMRQQRQQTRDPPGPPPAESPSRGQRAQAQGHDREHPQQPLQQNPQLMQPLEPMQPESLLSLIQTLVSTGARSVKNAAGLELGGAVQILQQQQHVQQQQQQYHHQGTGNNGMGMQISAWSMPQQHQPPWNGSQLSSSSSSQSGSINLSGFSGGVDLRGQLGQAGAGGQMSQQQQQQLLLQLVGTTQQQLLPKQGLAQPPPPPPPQEQQYQNAFSFALSSLLGSGGSNHLYPQQQQHHLNLTMAAAQPPPSSVLNHLDSNLNSALFHSGGGNGVIGGINNGGDGGKDIMSILLNSISSPPQQQTQQQPQQAQQQQQGLQQAQQQLQQAEQQALAAHILLEQLSWTGDAQSQQQLHQAQQGLQQAQQQQQLQQAEKQALAAHILLEQQLPRTGDAQSQQQLHQARQGLQQAQQQQQLQQAEQQALAAHMLMKQQLSRTGDAQSQQQLHQAQQQALAAQLLLERELSRSGGPQSQQQHQQAQQQALQMLGQRLSQTSGAPSQQQQARQQQAHQLQQQQLQQAQQQTLAAQLLEQQLSRAGPAAAAVAQSPLLSLNGMIAKQKQQLLWKDSSPSLYDIIEKQKQLLRMHQQEQHRLQERNNGNQKRRGQQIHQQEQQARQSQHSQSKARQAETTKPPQRLQHRQRRRSEETTQIDEGSMFGGNVANGAKKGSINKDESLDVLWKMIHEDRHTKNEETMSLLGNNDFDDGVSVGAGSTLSLNLDPGDLGELWTTGQIYNIVTKNLSGVVAGNNASTNEEGIGCYNARGSANNGDENQDNHHSTYPAPAAATAKRREYPDNDQPVVTIPDVHNLHAPLQHPSHEVVGTTATTAQAATSSMSLQARLKYLQQQQEELQRHQEMLIDRAREDQQQQLQQQEQQQFALRRQSLCTNDDDPHHFQQQSVTNNKSHQNIDQGLEPLSPSMSLPSSNSNNDSRRINNSHRWVDTAPTLFVTNTNYARASSSGLSHPTAAPKALRNTGKQDGKNNQVGGALETGMDESLGILWKMITEDKTKRGLGGDGQERDDDTLSMYSADDTMSLSMNPESGDNLWNTNDGSMLEAKEKNSTLLRKFADAVDVAMEPHVKQGRHRHSDNTAPTNGHGESDDVQSNPYRQPQHNVHHEYGNGRNAHEQHQGQQQLQYPQEIQNDASVLIPFQKKPPTLQTSSGGRAQKGAAGRKAKPAASTTNEQSEFDAAFNAIMGGRGAK